MPLETYQAAFETFEKKLGGRSPSWLGPLREKALSRFGEIGFPTPKHEEWKYTNVKSLVEKPFQFSFESSLDGLTPEKIRPFLFGKTTGPVLVFVNGVYSEQLSANAGTGPYRDLSLRSLSAALCEHPKLIEPYLAKLLPYDQNGFTALNTAFLRDGFFLRVAEGTEVKEPIQILFISTPAKDRAISQPRNLIVLEKGARARVVETHLFWGQSPEGQVSVYFTNAVTEISLKKDASLDHYKIQKEDEKTGHHVAATRVRLEEGSRFSSFVISLGAKLARETLDVRLEGERSECILNGLYLVSKGRHVDHHTSMDHLKPRGKSRQFYKGVVSGKSTAVFNGKVYVRANAVKSDAEQTNKNLLLSDEATVDTKPQLEIDNDDVKCTHGAAVGQLDEEQLFYLRSRGVKEEEARSILTYAFVSEVLGRIEFEPVREALTDEVRKWL